MADHERAGDYDEGYAGEGNTSLLEGLDLHLGAVDVGEVGEEFFLAVCQSWHRFEVVDFVLGELEVVDERDYLVDSTEEGEGSLERIFAEEELEHGFVIVLAVFPVSVGHGELVQVC